MGVLRLAHLRLGAAVLVSLLGWGLSLSAVAQTSTPLLLQFQEIEEWKDEPNQTVDDAQFERAYEKYLSDPELQRERPVFEIEPPEELPDIETRKPWKFPLWLGSLGAGFGNLLKLVFWVAIVLGVLAIIYFLVTQLRNTNLRRRKDKSGKDKPEDDHYVDIRPDEKTARTLLEEADALASSGSYADAVHLLLFRAIDDIQQRLDGGLPKSLTAREIGQLDSIPDRAKSALAPIIQVVERSFFGDADVTESDWHTARKAYESFAFGEGWS